MKILHLITDLDTGGAELMLYRLLSQGDLERHPVRVVSLIPVGAVAEKIRSLGVPVESLGMKRGLPNPLAVLRLRKLLQQDPPDLIQSWMYHADLIGSLANRSLKIPLVWGIHNSNLEPGKSKRTTIWTAKACARLSHRHPSKIVCCSQASYRVHSQLGYVSNKMLVIPNGFLIEQYCPDASARQAIRQELGVSDCTPLVGLIARFDPQKDHENFVRAAGHLHASHPEVHYLLCGTDVTPENSQLMSWIEQQGTRDNFHLLGRRENVPQIMAALDILATSSAYGEAFPLVIGEAMACGVPCAVTDVGDSAEIVAQTGRVVPSRDPKVLADAWKELLEMSVEERSALGRAARQRIVENFDLKEIANRYSELYQSVLKENR